MYDLPFPIEIACVNQSNVMKVNGIDSLCCMLECNNSLVKIKVVK